MKKFIQALTAIIVFSSAGQALAGAGHSHGVSEPISKEQAVQRASLIKQQLVTSQQISSTWTEVAGGNTEQRSTAGGNLWVVEYANPKAEDDNKGKLFVFLDEFGNPVGANHSGDL
ncbi:DUF6488 family protein [uncultured Marinobacter sp.]|uniref:DUF6488 family protein n=1 Tax=uncultured Marinobacter sp. TaxID=187379 RepID=UPI00261D74FD|nr:DUF6488 family protein [uncultured Marinobacter sp.]